MADVVGEAWGVDAGAVAEHLRSYAPQLTPKTISILNGFITGAAAEINSRVRQWTGQEPATLAAGTSAAHREVQGIAGSYIKNRVAERYLRPEKPEASDRYKDDADAIMTNARYSIPEARQALTITTGPPRTDGRSEPEPSWLDKPDKELFG